MLTAFHSSQARCSRGWCLRPCFHEKRKALQLITTVWPRRLRPPRPGFGNFPHVQLLTVRQQEGTASRSKGMPSNAQEQGAHLQASRHLSYFLILQFIVLPVITSLLLGIGILFRRVVTNGERQFSLPWSLAHNVSKICRPAR